jgi:hypothetical protein
MLITQDDFAKAAMSRLMVDGEFLSKKRPGF